MAERSAAVAGGAEVLEPLAVLSRFPAHVETLNSVLEARTQVVGDRPFVEFRGQARSYRDILDDAQAAAIWFSRHGVRAGNRVAVMSANHPSTIVALLALARLGAVMCPVNPDLREIEATELLRHADICGAVCSPACLPVLRAALAKIASPAWVLLNEPGASTLDLPAWPDEMQPLQGARTADAGMPDSTCVLVYTSGTTGTPKGVMHSQRAFVLAGEGFVGRLFLQPADRLLCVLPMFHINALFYSVCGSLCAGATVLLQRGFSASTFWKVAAETRATEVNFVAAIPAILGRRPLDEFDASHCLKKICVAPLSVATEQLLRERFRVSDLIDGYGMTEIPGVAITPMNGPRKVGSVGLPCRHPDPRRTFAELRVVDDDGRDVPAGVTGEFLVRTPTVMQGYFRDPEQTRAAFRDGWFVTGDLGYRDTDGFIWFVARKKDIIRKRGENIAGAELDRVVGEHPAVLEAAAIAVPAELGEDEILVAVVRRPGIEVSAAGIADWCAQRLARIKVPRYVVFVDALPHTATHRVAKHLLKADPGLRARATDLALEHSA